MIHSIREGSERPSIQADNKIHNIFHTYYEEKWKVITSIGCDITI